MVYCRRNFGFRSKISQIDTFANSRYYWRNVGTRCSINKNIPGTIQKIGKNSADLQVGINNHMFIGEDSQKAADNFYPSHASMMIRVGPSRGWPPATPGIFNKPGPKKEALIGGGEQEVFVKIHYEK